MTASGELPDAVVVLAGRDWAVPALAPRQNRIIVPALIRWSRAGEVPLSTEQYDDAIAIVHTALTRAHPDLTRTAFEDLPVSAAELLAALPVIARQTGLFGTEGKASPPGEA